MKLQTIYVASSIVATGAKFIINIKNRKALDQLEAALKERNRQNYKRVLADMAATHSIVDKVLDGDYGTDFGRAMRDIRSDREFNRIAERFHD